MLLNSQVMLNFLYFYGICGLIKESLLHRYFSKVRQLSLMLSMCMLYLFDISVFSFFFSCWQGVRGSSQVPESDIVLACRSVSVLNLFVSLCCTWEDCLSYSAILMFFSIIVLILPSAVVGSKA